MPVFIESQIVATGNYRISVNAWNRSSPDGHTKRGPTGPVNTDVTAEHLHLDNTCHGNRMVAAVLPLPPTSPCRSLPTLDVRYQPRSRRGSSWLSALFRWESHRPDTRRGDHAGDAAVQPAGSTHRRTPALHSVGIPCDKRYLPSATASFTVLGSRTAYRLVRLAGPRAPTSVDRSGGLCRCAHNLGGSPGGSSVTHRVSLGMRPGRGRHAQSDPPGAKVWGFDSPADRRHYARSGEVVNIRGVRRRRNLQRLGQVDSSHRPGWAVHTGNPLPETRHAVRAARQCVRVSAPCGPCTSMSP